MTTFYSYIDLPEYFKPTHSLSLLTLGSTPLWLGFIVDAHSNRILDARWHGKKNDENASKIDSFCTQCSGVNASETTQLKFPFTPLISPLFFHLS
tara:strand:+ start:791 stop:1075 length:285 start_codon:yes stop_codon:yes gene_type:complete